MNRVEKYFETTPPCTQGRVIVTTDAVLEEIFSRGVYSGREEARIEWEAEWQARSSRAHWSGMLDEMRRNKYDVFAALALGAACGAFWVGLLWKIVG